MEYYKVENLEKLIRDSERLAIIRNYATKENFISKETLLILLGTKPDENAALTAPNEKAVSACIG